MSDLDAKRGMSIIALQVIVPDSSHWAQWIDCALNTSKAEHRAALKFHDRLMTAGRIPLMSWHHLEELLAIDDDAWARRRIAFIQALPFVAYMRFPSHAPHCGSIIDVLSAEVTAIINGETTLKGVRDHARKLLIQTGTGENIIGSEAGVWDVIRQELLLRKNQTKLIAATRRMSLFDDRKTIGELVKGSIRTAEDQEIRFSIMGAEVLDHIKNRGDPVIADPHVMASDFMGAVKSLKVPEGIDVRSLLEFSLISQGVDLEEIHDEDVLADLKDLGIFRTRLKVIAENINVPFDKLKIVNMRILPSWQTQHLIERFGQDRKRRPGSDIADECLSALAPYVDELFVDKRTAEDFRRLKNRPEMIISLLGIVRKSANYDGIACTA